MATRNSVNNVGSAPPFVKWTIVRGDTAGFKVYVVDDLGEPLNIPDWTIAMDIRRPNDVEDLGVITDDAVDVFSLSPAADEDDLSGEFTVSITAAQSALLRTGDIFDIQLSLPQDAIVWTVAQGSIELVEDVTNG